MSADPTSSSASPTSFRPDIQGIRALAVLLVIVDHLWPGRLPGGYIGVDVFFVVSGYLITRLLLGGAARSGRISLTDFYARRARRILPAATVVTVVTVVVSLLTLPLLRVQTILGDAVWATFFGANIRMARTGTDYFAIGQPPSPFRHYWSLSVEEQFYLFWPLLLLLVLVLVHARGGSDRAFRRTAGVLVAAVVVASLVWSVWATHHSPVTAYFSTLTRTWELGIGAACAILARRTPLPTYARQGLALGGLVAIGAAAVLFTARTPFPGVAALVPVLGTAALIVAGQTGVETGSETAVGRLLSIRPMVVVGDWSYSLYLWHWPVIVLLRSNFPERFSTLPVQLGTLVLVFVVSWASFRWVETPFRHGSWRRRSRSLAIYPVSIALVLLTVVVSTQVVRYQLGEFSNEPPVATQDYPDKHLGKDPYVALVRASVLAAKDGRAVPGHLTPSLIDLRQQTAPLGDCDYRTGTTKLCPVGDTDAERTIVLVGDSHARALAPALERIGEENGYLVYVLVYSGCSANSLVQIDRATERAFQPCEDFKAWARATIADLAPELVVVSTSAGVVLDPGTGKVLSASPDLPHYLSVLQDGWQTYFADLSTVADRVAIIGNTPKLPKEPGVCLSSGHPNLGDCAFAPGPQARREAEASFAAARSVGVKVVDASRWFCAEKLCPAVVGNFITLRDSEHMTPDYARSLATPLAAALGVAEGSSTAILPG